MPMKRKIEVFMNGEPTSVGKIKEITHKEKLQAKLGEYMTSKEIRERTGISPRKLRDWHLKGKVRATKEGSRYIYSLQDVRNAINSE